jgi:hypothetical protein
LRLLVTDTWNSSEEPTYVALWEYEIVPVEDATALAVETGVTVMVE